MTDLHQAVFPAVLGRWASHANDAGPGVASMCAGLCAADWGWGVGAKRHPTGWPSPQVEGSFRGTDLPPWEFSWPGSLPTASWVTDDGEGPCLEGCGGRCQPQVQAVLGRGRRSAES